MKYKYSVVSAAHAAFCSFYVSPQKDFEDDEFKSAQLHICSLSTCQTPSLRSALFIYTIGTMCTNENTKRRDARLIRTPAPTGFFLRTYWHSRGGGRHSRRPLQGQEDRSGSHQRNIRREALRRVPTGCSINQRERREKRDLDWALSGDSFGLDQSPHLSIPIGFRSP